VTAEHAARRDDREPQTPAALARTPLRPDDLAVTWNTDDWFCVLRRAPRPAGEFLVDDTGRPLADLLDCEPDADVVVAVDIDRVRDRVAVDPADADVTVAELVERAGVTPEAIPATWLVPALEEFRDARREGAWGGLRDYIREADT
jgi:hypothetical protein